jgi:hypothetical protein
MWNGLVTRAERLSIATTCSCARYNISFVVVIVTRAGSLRKILALAPRPGASEQARPERGEQAEQ